MVSREVRRDQQPDGAYRPHQAHQLAAARRTRPKLSKIAGGPGLRAIVPDGLEHRHSPRQIARRLRRDHPDRPEWHVTHETIYQTLYVQAKGRSAARDRLLVTHRPSPTPSATPARRAAKNHGSAIGTLVERATRFVMLPHLPDGYSPAAVRDAMVTQIQTLPEQLRRSLTWDQGSEMHFHGQFTDTTNMPVYFRDPHSPWQHGSNQNTNSLLRQYVPTDTNLSVHSAEHPDHMATELNDRPRTTLS